MLSMVRMLRGYPCCCSGDKALKIRSFGNQTEKREDVTCKDCLGILKRQDKYHEDHNC